MKQNKMVEKNNSTNKKAEYGVLSLMAMIIRIVVGSGIFAKNARLIITTGSLKLVFEALAIGAIVVISLVVTFLEVISITEIAGEQSTVSN